MRSVAALACPLWSEKFLQDSLAIYDVTNKARPYIISNTTYSGASCI